MKRIINLIILINIVLSANSQEIGWEKKWGVLMRFDTDWLYFRMKANPLLSREQTHDGVNWKISPSRVLLPDSIRKKNYMPDIKISEWGEFRGSDYIDRPFSLPHFGFYLVEKGDGYTGVKKTFMTDSIIDIIHLNIYDSIFPYDNRFLVKYLYTDKTSFTEYYSCHSGNVMWGDWKDVGYIKGVDYCGYFRGVQFGIEKVMHFNQKFSDKIKSFRPDFPNYVYTQNRSISLLTNGFVIIGAPEGKEDELVEYIFYSNMPEKTGDPDESHYYEMRYILPTQIKSVKERRLEKRRLTDEEQQYILDGKNGMLLFHDGEDNIFDRAIKNILKEANDPKNVIERVKGDEGDEEM